MKSWARWGFPFDFSNVVAYVVVAECIGPISLCVFALQQKNANHDFYSVALCFLKTKLAYLFCTIRLNGGTPEPHLSVF